MNLLPDFHLYGCLFYPEFNENLKTGWLKGQNFILSQLWRLQVQDHSAGRAGFFLGLTPGLGHGYVLPACPHSVCLSS
jgi:hypothetical protein